MTNEFSITLYELEKALEFSKKNGKGKFKLINITISNDSRIGLGYEASTPHKEITEDITNYDCW